MVVRNTKDALMAKNDDHAMRWANACVNAYCRKNGIAKDDPRYAHVIDLVVTNALNEYWQELLPER